jgi:multidrug resistance efflux pump
VAPGAPLMRLRNLPLQSKLDESQAAFLLAINRANTASLHHTNLGRALKERESTDKQRKEWQLQGADLEISSPISGVVLTPRIGDREGEYLPEGTEVAEVANLATMRGRVYISEYDMDKVHLNSAAKLSVDGFARKWRSKLESIAPVSSESDPRLVQNTQYSGLNPPKFYVVDLLVSNSDKVLRPGMVGTARIIVRKRSIAGLACDSIVEFFGRKVW